MWILYIAIAIVVSTGTGIYLSRNTDVAIDDAARIQAPQVQAVQANQVARYLRRMYLEDPTMFPARPSSGETLIPNNLVAMAVTQGNQLPSGVNFVLRADGQIVPMFLQGSNGSDLRDDMLDQSFTRVVELDGVAPHIYGRRSGPIDRGYEGTEDTGQPGGVVIVDDPTDGGDTGGPGGEVEDGSGNTGDDGQGGVDDGGGSGDDGGSGGSDPGGDGDDGGTGGDDGQGGTGSDPNNDDDENTDSELTIEDLQQGGGSGGSDSVNPDSYRIAENGDIYVTEDYETYLGPRAPFYSSDQLEQLVQEIETKKAQSQYIPSDYIKPLYFDAFNDESYTRSQSEDLFGIVCSGVLETLTENFEAKIEQTIYDVIDMAEYWQEEECDPRDGRDEYDQCVEAHSAEHINEDITTVAATVATAGAYCMSVMEARIAEFPVRANRGNYTNEDALHSAGDFLNNFVETAWYMNKDNDPAFVQQQPSSLIALKDMVKQVQNTRNVELTYPVTEGQ